MGHAQKTDFNFDPLDEDNYDTWRVKIKKVLTHLNLWKYVDGDSASKPSSDQVDELPVWEKNNKTAKSTITLNITNKTLKKLDLNPEFTAKETFGKIETVFGTKKKSDDSDEILKKLLNLSEIGEGVDLKLALNNFFDLVHKLKESKVDLFKNNSLLSNILLNILPASFKKFKVDIMSNDKLPDVTLLAIKILEYYDKIDEESSDEDEEEDDNQDAEKEEEVEVVKKISEEKEVISKNTSSLENKDGGEDNEDSGYNGSYFQDISNNDTSSQANYEEELTRLRQALAESKLNELLNREEYLSQNYDYQNCSLLPEYCDQKQDDCVRSTEEDRQYLQSLLKSGPKKKSEKTGKSASPKKCSICHQEGHNKRTCDKLSSSSKTSDTSTSKRTYKCGVCGDEGHNKTTCPLNSSKNKSTSSSSLSSTTPKKSYKCSICNEEGHNKTTCSKNSPVNIITSTPKQTYKCGNCGKEGHNRTTCPQNIQAALESSVKVSAERSYSCGLCGQQGHNRRTCLLNTLSPNSSVSSTTARDSSSSSISGQRSYSCGLCGQQGHNRRTCSMNVLATTPSSNSGRSLSTSSSVTSSGRSYSCGLCGGQGHNRTTCSLNYSSSSSFSYGGGYIGGGGYGGGGGSSSKRSYTCGTCGGSGHNSRTCSYR